MVDQMVKAAQERRWSRTLGAFIIGLIAGAFIFSGFEVGFCGGLFCAALVWVWESKEVDRVKKIQNPWRDE